MFAVNNRVPFKMVITGYVFPCKFSQVMMYLSGGNTLFIINFNGMWRLGSGETTSGFPSQASCNFFSKIVKIGSS